MKNILVDLVEREYEALKDSVAGFCTCTPCKEDVLVYTLNRLPPRYVAQRAGEVISNIALEADQSKTDVSVLLLEAMRKVKAQPRAGHASPMGPDVGG